MYNALPEETNTLIRNLWVLQAVLCLLKNVYKQKMDYGTGNLCLLQNVSLENMLGL